MLGQYEIKGPISKDIMDQNTAQRPKKKEKKNKKTSLDQLDQFRWPSKAELDS